MMISMDRKELVLAAMAPADGGWFTPVQVQKLFFLIDMNIGANVGGPHFAFTPYHYGPFDADVYREIEDLASRGMAEAYPNESFRMRKFCLTLLVRTRANGFCRKCQSESEITSSVLVSLCEKHRLHNWCLQFTKRIRI